ncbi:MAG: transglutaminase domain-containing protein [Ginsengibacter sp.]
MKRFACIICLVWCVGNAYAQTQPSIPAFTFSSEKDLQSPKYLAEYLTHNNTSEKEKVQSIFSWITNNISYRVRERNYKDIEITDDFGDSLYMSKSTDEIIAEKVLKKQSAYCDGYSRLFKILCNYAGLQCEVISGYARIGSNIKRKGFNPNHKWNAVKIDSTWNLVDVTWASGYVSSGEFVQRYDPFYYLTPPQAFVKDHLPEDLKWSLLEEPPVPKEFKQSPFEYNAFNQYNIVSYKPATGFIDAKIGDTLAFEIQTYNSSKTLQILPDFETTKDYEVNDSTVRKFDTGALQNLRQYYTVVPNSGWIYVVYNNEAVLRYRINIKG